MEHIRLGDVVVIFADILKSAWRSIIAVADDHTFFHHECAYLPALAVGVLGPDACHPQIAEVKLSLFLF